LGAKKIIVYSWCGSLSSRVTCEAMVVGRWGISEEGTSCHYPVVEQPDSTPRLREWLHHFCQQHNYPIQEGKIWTTDAPYRELRATIDKYGQQGLIGVDMEFTALVTVAAFRAIELAALFMVSDELWREQWQPSFSTKRFKKKSRAIIRALCQQLATL